jgi:hypothetical protein
MQHHNTDESSRIFSSFGMERFGVGSEAAVYLHIIPNEENNDFNIIKENDTLLSLRKVSDGLNGGIQKIQNYSVDKILIDSSERVEIEKYHELFAILRQRSSSLALDLGINSSVWLIGRHFSNNFGDLLFTKSIDSTPEYVDFFQKLCAELSSSLQQLVTKSSYRMSSGIKVKCFEVYGEQIRDLLISNESFASPSLPPPIIREIKSIPYVDSLSEVDCATADEAYSVLHRAYQRRLSLIVESLESGRSVTPGLPVIDRNFVGYVGNVIIQIEITQTLCSPPPASVEVHPQFIHRTGIIQFNLLADMDSLAYKPVSKSDSLVVVPLNSIRVEGGAVFVPGAPVIVALGDLPLQPLPKLIPLQLITSAKALSTLSRVVNALFLRESQASTSISNSSTHISYRDSVLTRVLQASLQGNLANCIGLFLDLRRNRFCSLDTSSASAVSCANSLRMMSELQGAMQMSLFLRSSDTKSPMTKEELQKFIPDFVSNSVDVARDPISPLVCEEASNPILKSQTVGPTLQSMFWDLFNSMKTDSMVSSMISELLTLEQERNLLLESFGGQRFDDAVTTPNYLLENVSESQPSVCLSVPVGITDQSQKLFRDLTLNHTNSSISDPAPLLQTAHILTPQTPLSKQRTSSLILHASLSTTHNSRRPSSSEKKDSSSVKAISLPAVQPRGRPTSNSRSIEPPLAPHGLLAKNLFPLSPPRSAGNKATDLKRGQRSRIQKSKSVIPHLPAPLQPSTPLMPSTQSFSSLDRSLGTDTSPSMVMHQRSNLDSSSPQKGSETEKTSQTCQAQPLDASHRPLPTETPQDLLLCQIVFPEVLTSSSHLPACASSPRTNLSASRPHSPLADSPTTKTEHTPRQKLRGGRGGELDLEPDPLDPPPGKDPAESNHQFLKAVSRSNVSLVQSYLRQGSIDLSVKNSFGMFVLPLPSFLSESLLHPFSVSLMCRDAVQISVRNGSLEILTLLHEAGASLDTRGKRGDSLFHLAAANGHLRVLEWLTSMGVRHDLVDSTGQTCVHVAARRGEVEVLKYLESVHQMDLNQRDQDEETPLAKVPKTSLQGNEKELEETRTYLLSQLEMNAEVLVVEETECR